MLVLDEPTVGLDIDSRRDIVEHVHGLCREESLAVLWATHLIDEIEPGDRVVLLHRGRVRAAGSIAEVVQRRRRRATWATPTGSSPPRLAA